MNVDFVIVKGPDPVALLLERIPEVREQIDPCELDLPYAVFGAFARFIEALDRSSALFSRCMEALNELSETGHAEVQNLVQVAVMEPLTDDEALARAVRPHLRGCALRLFLAAAEYP